MSTDKYIAPLDGLKNVVRARLRELGISAREASRRAGFNVGYVGDLLEGRSKEPGMERIAKLALALDLPVGDLVQTAAPAVIEKQEPPTKLSGEPRLIPLYAARVAMNKPFLPIDWKPVGYVPTLPSLELIDGAYAVTVFNDLNAPRYFPGETVYVSPAATIREGDFTFGYTVSGAAGIGRFVGVDGTVGRWALIGTGEVVEVPIERLARLHRIVGSVG